jgi:hypothetical protein
MPHPTDTDGNFQIVRNLWPDLPDDAKLAITQLVREIVADEGPPHKQTKAIPWTPAEDELVRTYSVREVMRRTKRTLAAVCQRRVKLGVRFPIKRRKG